LARAFYNQKRAAGKGQNAVLRALGSRRIEVLWRCLHRHVLDDDAIHAANRNHAPQPLPRAA
jgi:hypothetical protein